jgi:2-polyprenyl-6-methoxyphenol hydroxylase-like FAD-dependent oxidoreductase
VVLVGDAAHACPPTLAHGGAQALEDAAVLTELLLSRTVLDNGLWSAFTARRFARAKAVVEASCQLGQWQLGHEQGDVPGLLATITALVSEPA